MRYNAYGYQRQAREFADTHGKGQSNGAYWRNLREENARRHARAMAVMDARTSGGIVRS